MGRLRAVGASLEPNAIPSVTVGLPMRMPLFVLGELIQDRTRAIPAAFRLIVRGPVVGAVIVPTTVVPLSEVPLAPGISQLDPGP